MGSNPARYSAIRAELASDPSMPLHPSTSPPPPGPPRGPHQSTELAQQSAASREQSQEPSCELRAASSLCFCFCLALQRRSLGLMGRGALGAVAIRVERVWVVSHHTPLAYQH